MTFDFDEQIDRRNTGSIKWNFYKDPNILPMWVADMDFRVAPAVTESLNRSIDHGVFGYTKAPKSTIDVTIAYVEKQYGWKIDPEWLVWLPGLVTGLNYAAMTLAKDRPEIATLTPAYPPFLIAPEKHGRKTLEVPLSYENNYWAIDFDITAKLIGKNTGMFFLCNPHNPAGRVFSRDELIQFAEICAKERVIIISDEIHCDLVLDEDKKHIPVATLDEEIAQQTITMMAPSKTYNVPGLGCAFAIIPNRELRENYAPAHPGIVPHLNTLGYAACEGAFANGEEWRKELLIYLRQNRDYLQNRIKSELPGIQMAHVEATYLAWIDIRSLGLEKPAEYFADYGLGLNCGKTFSGFGFVRLNFATPKATLVEGLNRFAKAVKNLN